jgi:hypothetical protein
MAFQRDSSKHLWSLAGVLDMASSVFFLEFLLRVESESSLFLNLSLIVLMFNPGDTGCRLSTKQFIFCGAEMVISY